MEREFLIDLLGCGSITLLLVAFQLHVYLAPPTDLDEDLDAMD